MRFVRALFGVGCVLASACAEERPLDWSYDVAPGLEFATVGARILEGGCDGRAVYDETFREGAAPRPGGLGAGVYGFEISLSDERCDVVGRGCREVELPTMTAALVVQVEAVDGPLCAGVCVEGRCTGGGSDAGVLDAGDADGGVRDGGYPDGGDAATSCPACDSNGDRCVEGVCVPRTPVRAVQLGSQHSCAVAEDSRLFCWGRSAVGEVGTGRSDETVATPRQILGSGWETLAVGVRSSCGVRSGAGLCWGANADGQLGLGAASETNVFAPTAQPMPISFDSLALGLDAGFGVLGGRLYGWGTNENFALGDWVARDARVDEPTPIPGLDSVATVSVGLWSTFVLREDGTLLAFGWNRDGELGTGGSGSSDAAPAPVGPGAWAGVSAGIGHTCGWTRTGEVFCWGAGAGPGIRGCEAKDGALGIGEVSVTTPEAVPGLIAAHVSAGCSTCLVDRTGGLWCFGPNASGELGTGDDVAHLSPAAVAPELRFTAVETSVSHTCAIREGGALYCWGDDTDRVLGVGGVERALVPQRVVIP